MATSSLTPPTAQPAPIVVFLSVISVVVLQKSLARIVKGTATSYALSAKAPVWRNVIVATVRDIFHLFSTPHTAAVFRRFAPRAGVPENLRRAR